VNAARKRIPTLAALVALLTSAVRAEATPTGLSEARIVELAVQAVPTVLAARHEAETARASTAAAERARLPDLVVGGSYIRLSSIPSRYRSLGVALPDGSNLRLTVPQVLDVYTARAALVVSLSDSWLGLAAQARAAGALADAKRPTGPTLAGISADRAHVGPRRVARVQVALGQCGERAPRDAQSPTLGVCRVRGDYELGADHFRRARADLQSTAQGFRA